MNEEERNKIIIEIKEINEKIQNTYLSEKTREYYKKISDKERGLRALKKPIYEKYIKRYSRLGINRNTGLKPSVKRGIKRGLGVKYLNQIYEENFVKIVRQLIKEDLKKTDENKILVEIKRLNELSEVEYKKLKDEREFLKRKVNKLSYKLNKERIDKEREKRKEMEDIAVIIDEKLPELLPKIRQEITKELILEGLNE